jgi:hypothetical protein
MDYKVMMQIELDRKWKHLLTFGESESEEDVVGGKPHRARRVSGTGYFESHCKVLGINTVEEWQKLAKLCASSAWTNRKISVPLLSNFDSAKGPYPVTTLRMYETDLKTFLEEHDKFIAFLKLRLEFVAFGQFEAPSSSIPNPLAGA